MPAAPPPRQLWRVPADPGPAEAEGPPELADLGRLARRLVRKAVSTARAEDTSVRRLLMGHLGASVATLPVATASWPRYDHGNVQAGRLAPARPIPSATC
jgi:hypothetical protein